MNTADAIKAIGQILCRKDAKAIISTRLGHLPTTTAAVFGLFEGLGEVTLATPRPAGFTSRSRASLKPSSTSIPRPAPCT